MRDTARLAADTSAHYTFVSSISVYRDLSAPGVQEDAPVHTLEDETVAEAAIGDLFDGPAERPEPAAAPGKGAAPASAEADDLAAAFLDLDELSIEEKIALFA